MGQENPRPAGIRRVAKKLRTGKIQLLSAILFMLYTPDPQATPNGLPGEF